MRNKLQSQLILHSKYDRIKFLKRISILITYRTLTDTVQFITTQVLGDPQVGTSKWTQSWYSKNQGKNNIVPCPECIRDFAKLNKFKINTV